MKYHYEFDTFTFHDGTKNLIIGVDASIDLVAGFLITEVSYGHSYQWYMNKIVEVQTGVYEEFTLRKNVYQIEIHPDFTKVVDMLSEDTTNNSCMIETSELKELMDIWVAKQKDFDETGIL